MVLEGMGIALLPETLVRNEIKSGALNAIKSDWLPAPLSFYARHAPQRAPLFVGKAAKLAMETMRAGGDTSG